MTTLGINSGLGVSLYPFKKYLVGNIEVRGIFHTSHNEQWASNFQGIPLYKKFPKKLKTNIDVVIGSPDCGSGSVLRLSRAKKLGDSSKNKSILLFISGILTYKPKFFYFENLPTLFKSFDKQRWVYLLHQYHLIEYIEPVSAWGNSQVSRKRLVVIGIKKEGNWKKLIKYFKLPEKVELKKCGELYGSVKGDLGLLTGHVREEITDVISIYGGKKMSLWSIQNRWCNELHKSKRWVVEESEGRKFSTAPGVYRNLDDDYPATARKANRQFDQSGLTLTPRQLARVQGVPDSFQIHFDSNKPKYWINKGRTVITKTPPYEISVWFKKCLKKSYHIWKD